MSRPVPLPSLGPAQLREARRHILCVACPPGTSASARRIDHKTRLGRPWPPGNTKGTLAHRSCARRLERELRTYGDTSGPSTGEEVATDSKPIRTAVSTPPLSRYSSPLTSALAMDSRRMFAEYDYALLSVTPASLQLAQQLATLDCSTAASTAVNIAGEVRQYDLLQALCFPQELQSAWKGVVGDSLVSIGIGDEVVQHHMVAQKMLVARPRKGEQITHWDSSDGWLATDQLSILLYCTDGCQSTALPRFSSAREFGWGSKELPGPYTLQQKAHLLDAEWFHSVVIQAGQVLIFRESVPHFGTRNRLTNVDRRVLFSMLSPSRAVNQDEQQVFQWSYIADAYGDDSLEYAHALVHARRFTPLVRLNLADQEIAIQCLKTHALYEQYNRR